MMVFNNTHDILTCNETDHAGDLQGHDGLSYVVILLSSARADTQNAGVFYHLVMSEMVLRCLTKCVSFPLNGRVLTDTRCDFMDFLLWFPQSQRQYLLCFQTSPSDCQTCRENLLFKHFHNLVM